MTRLPLDVGVMLPVSGAAGGSGRTGYAVTEAARLAEELGFSSVWASDHLAFRTGLLEPVVALTAASAVTRHVRVAFGVLLAALRQPAWVAKQVSSLQVLSGDRVILGIGVGGENPNEWVAAGVPVRQRGRRTDRLLEVLPTMLAGRPARLPAPWDAPVPALAPTAAVPPIWIGGRHDAAVERAARFGDGWLALWLDGRTLAERRALLHDRARGLGRPAPRTGIAVFVNADDRDPDGAREAASRYLHRQYGSAAARLGRYVLAGRREDVCRGLGELVAGGADQLVLVPAGGDSATQYRRLAEIRTDLPTTVSTVGGRRGDAGNTPPPRTNASADQPSTDQPSTDQPSTDQPHRRKVPACPSVSWDSARTYRTGS
jgi:alkanesulfonate monooxygenase SsuD/methylene tetrahydromethanopterin reductase-like flavin-dependent oxidoreductase (luciferase family)